MRRIFVETVVNLLEYMYHLFNMEPIVKTNSQVYIIFTYTSYDCFCIHVYVDLIIGVFVISAGSAPKRRGKKG